MPRYNHFAHFWAAVPEPNALTPGQCRYAQRVLGLRRVVPLPGHPGYAASACGHIVSSLPASSLPGTYRVLASSPADERHSQVNLRVGRRSRRRLVHRLIALAFLGPPPKGRPMVLHKDDDRANNAVENLYHGTRADNVRDAHANNRYIKGERHYAAKLTTAAANELRRQAAAGTPRAALLEKYGISRTTLYEVLANRRWASPAAAA